MGSSVETAILAAEQRRCAAMLAADNATLGPLLDERLHFCHSNANVDSKDIFLAKLAAGRIVYSAIAWSEQQITELAPGAAMLTGKVAMAVRVEGNDRQLRNQVITVWSLTGGHWRMVAFQSTPLPA